METTISIIVPVYNIIEYLPRCVESLRKQTYDKIEILLVDDGSTDGTAELCDKLAAEDVRIREDPHLPGTWEFRKQQVNTSAS